MTDQPLATLELETKRLKLDTLITLRWLAVIGQTVAVMAVRYGLGFPFPIGFCFALIALSAWLNLFLKLRYPESLRLEHRWAALLLAYDIVQLGGLLFLTGGLENPFAILIVVPVIVSATTLGSRQTMLLGGLALLVTTGLTVEHLKIPWVPGQALELPLVYLAGVWTAIVCTVVFMGIYAFRGAEEARRLADALAATEQVLAREQHLSALDGLAAAAAHELGTPLATIALVAKELEREAVPGTPNAEDIALLRSQAQRCRDILAKLTSLSAQTDWHHARLSLAQLVAEVVEPHQELGVTIRVAGPVGEGPEPVGRRSPAIIYGLGNIVENAVDFASSTVDIATSWTASDVTITVMDDGPGFASDIIGRIGEPYVTSRTPTTDGDSSEEAGGLGLGFFIAKTLLERTGARLTLVNRETPLRGAIVTIRWPRAAMDTALHSSEMPMPAAVSTSWTSAKEAL